MKYIKILTIIGLLSVMCSCTQRDFTPEVGTTPVEFVPNTEMTFASALVYIPVRQIGVSNTSTEVSIKINSCEAVNISDETVTLEEGKDFVVTDKDIYVTPRDGSDTTTSFEIRFPDFQYYKTVTISASLEGKYLGSNRDITIVCKGADRYTLDGVFTLTYRHWYSKTMETMDVEIVKDPEGDLLTYYVRFFGEKEGGFLAQREVNTLRILNNFAYPLQIAEDQGDFPLFCVYCSFEDLTADYGYFYPMPDATMAATFTYSGDKEFRSTGFCISYGAPFDWQNTQFCPMDGSAVRVE